MDLDDIIDHQPMGGEIWTKYFNLGLKGVKSKK